MTIPITIREITRVTCPGCKRTYIHGPTRCEPLYRAWADAHQDCDGREGES